MLVGHVLKVLTFLISISLVVVLVVVILVVVHLVVLLLVVAVLGVMVIIGSELAAGQAHLIGLHLCTSTICHQHHHQEHAKELEGSHDE